MGLFYRLKSVLGVARERARCFRVDLNSVEDLIGYRFRDSNLLLLGLTHRSYSRFDRKHSPSNERLEFLGDSVLGLVIADQLFQDSPDSREGDLGPHLVLGTVQIQP